MEILHETRELNKKTFFNHIFDSSETGIGSVLNSIQFCILAALPVTILNKLVQKYIPEFNPDSSSLELIIEIIIQLIVMIVGIILIYRMITYIPTYSGFKYNEISLTDSILFFLVIILSIQTKIGLKVSELWERLVYLWDGSETESNKDKVKKNVRVNNGSHTPSRADHLDNPNIQNTFPPAPVATTRQPAAPDMYDNMMGSGGGYSQNSYGLLSGPAPANSFVSSFGSMF
jgi:hypothetical protein